MLGKAKWFTRRKYSGWGLSPKTWQGWLYILVFILLVALINYLPITQSVKLVLTISLICLLLIDVVHIMLTLKKDERETKHEAIADRNALWVMLVVLIIGILYQTVTTSLNNQVPQVDYFLIGAILAAVIMKGITNYYLDKRD